MSQKRIEAEWLNFVRACFAPGLERQQLIDLKRTFFGGIAASFAIMQDSDPAEPVEDVVANLQAELLTFNEDVKAGRA